jgi:hypothetical protein
MAAWLYQMTSNDKDPWGPNQYRMEAWEGTPITWPVGNVIRNGRPTIARGDIIVFFFARRGNLEPGIYGWGIVMEVVGNNKPTRLKFQLCPPSDYRKIDVVWDSEVAKLVRKIQGNMAMATMWAMTNEQLSDIKKMFALGNKEATT